MAKQDINIKLTATDQTKAAFASAQSGLTRLNQTASTLGRSLGAAFPVLGVAGLAAFAKSGIDAADALNDMSQKLGVSVKDLASLKLIAEQSGTSLESVGTGMARLTKSIGEAEAGNKNMAKALQSLGVSARDPKEAFYQLADAVQRITDPSQRAALLSQVLGKSYGELVPLLNQGSDALRESAKQSETFAEAMASLAPDADKFNDQLALMKTNAAGAAAAILTRLVPSLSETAKKVSELMSEDKGISALVRALAGLGKIPFDLIIGDPFKIANTAPARIKELKSELNDLQRDLKSAQPGGGKSSVVMRAIFGTPEEINQKITIIKNQIQALEKFGEKIYKTPPGEKSDSGIININDVLKSSKAIKPKLDEIDPFYKERLAAEKALADEQNRIADFYIKQIEAENDAIYAQSDAWTAAGRELMDMIEPTNALVRKLTELDKLDGFIDPQILAAARLEINAQIDALGNMKDKLDEMDNFAKTAAENIQNSFADFLFDPFAEGLDGMLKGFGQTIQRMIADAVAADLAKWLFGDLIKGGSGGGVAGGLLSSVGELFSFAGGGYTGPGSRTGGVDGMGGFLSVLHPNETVIDHTKGQRSGHTIIVNVSGGSAPDVRRAAGQGAREALGMFSGAQRYA